MKQITTKTPITRKYFYLQMPHLAFKERLEQALMNQLIDNSKVDSHLRYHYSKYLYVVDKIMRSNSYYRKAITTPYPICYDHLYYMTNHVDAPKNLSNIKTMGKFLTFILEKANLIKRNNYFSEDKQISYKYKIIREKGFSPELFEIENLSLSKNNLNFIEKVNKNEGSEFYRETEIAQSMEKWMNDLDFSFIKEKEISERSLISIRLFQESRYQVLSPSGRIYNSFTNLPKVIRKKLNVFGEFIGEVDMGNAQVIFLRLIVLDNLSKLNEEPSFETREFFRWAEFGNAFEFINDRKRFLNVKNQRRDKFKKEFWSYCMDQNENMRNYKIIHPKMEKNLPQILQVIQDIKKEDHKIMSDLLQSKEAEIMKCAYEKIMKDIPSSLLHDGIYSQASKVDIVKERFIETLRNAGIKCAVKSWKRTPRNPPEISTDLTFVYDPDYLDLLENFDDLFKDCSFYHESSNDDENSSDEDWIF